MKDKKNILYVILCVLALLIVGGTTYAAFIYSNTGEENTIDTGTINFNYVEDDKALQITNPERISDEDAMISDNYFEFTISSSATGKVDVGYYVYLTTETSSDTSLDSSVKYYLTTVSDNIETAVTTPRYISNATPFDINTQSYNENATSRLLHSGYYTFNNEASVKNTTYRYRMWIDQNYPTQSYQTTEGEGSHIISSSKITYKVKINVLGIDGRPVEITN